MFTCSHCDQYESADHFYFIVLDYVTKQFDIRNILASCRYEKKQYDWFVIKKKNYLKQLLLFYKEILITILRLTNYVQMQKENNHYKNK